MRKILVFSDHEKTKDLFAVISRSRTYSVDFATLADLRRRISNGPLYAFVYVDISAERNLSNLRGVLSRNEDLLYGILDPKGEIEDPAMLFFEGASDYIGPGLLEKPLQTRRIKAVLEFRDFPEPDDEEVRRHLELGNRTATLPHAPANWKQIKRGSEYSFAFMFAEIDMYWEWKLKSGRTHLDTVLKTFYDHVERIVSPLGGRFWMRTDLGGLILFPYTGDCSKIIEEGFRLMMNAVLTSTEEYTYNTPITYRLALDIGRTVYRDVGQTGTIISDTVNFMFHLGQQYAQPDNFYLTGRAAAHIPSGLTDFFITTDTFQDEEIVRMRLPIRPF